MPERGAPPQIEAKRVGALVRDLRKQFTFLGDMGCYYFLYTVREKVPSWEEWCGGRGRHS